MGHAIILLNIERIWRIYEKKNFCDISIRNATDRLRG